MTAAWRCVPHARRSRARQVRDSIHEFDGVRLSRTFLVDDTLNELTVAVQSVDAAAAILAVLGAEFEPARQLVDVARTAVKAADVVVLGLRGRS